MTNPVKDKNIQLCVTGSIAAYKTADLASKLTQAGSKVDVILTQSALKFITPLTFQSVTGRRAYTDEDLWGKEGHVTHIALGHAANLLVVVPASANTIAKLAHGICDNLLTVTALAATCPILIAPAMDAGMYSHPATQANIETLKLRGVHFIGPAEGHLASGLTGKGRMVEPNEILGYIRWILGQNGNLKGKKIVITAGGTREPIDPVRLITNRSSGLQGYAIAQSALDSGANVTLITATTNLEPPTGCLVRKITTAQDMLEAVMAEIPKSDLLIMAAAVADFRPANPAQQKIKKNLDIPSIKLEKTNDILRIVSDYKNIHGYPKYVIGFAAESENLIENAMEKLNRKKLDMIIANDISGSESGFETEYNKVILLSSDNHIENLPLMKKSDVADIIINRASTWF